MTEANSGRFADLRLRVASAAVMLVLGGLAIWAGGAVFSALVVVVTALMIWELARLTGARAGAGGAGGDRAALALALLSALALTLVLAARSSHGGHLAELALLAPSLGFLALPGRDRLLAALWALAAMAAGLAMVSLRDIGLAPLLWLLGIVILSDISGYFAGRLLGGPKFWPAISPKKTWSGTVAGWIAALALSAVLLPFLTLASGWLFVLLAPLLALAGQMGDIAESWIKRRAGVKDASNLIPGHGGVMDRFDALTGAAALAMCIEWAGRVLGF